MRTKPLEIGRCRWTASFLTKEFARQAKVNIQILQRINCIYLYVTIGFITKLQIHKCFESTLNVYILHINATSWNKFSCRYLNTRRLSSIEIAWQVEQISSKKIYDTSKRAFSFLSSIKLPILMPLLDTTIYRCRQKYVK